jgi:hypothetical protein
MKRTYDNPNSLANLKLGAASRHSGKQRHCYTIKPETHEWLAKSGNASMRLDEMVGKILAGELVTIQKLERAEAEIKRLKEIISTIAQKPPEY